MSAKKHTKCPKCDGRGRTFIMSNGTVIDSIICTVCKGTKKVPKPKK